MSLRPCATGGSKCTSIVRRWCHQVPRFRIAADALPGWCLVRRDVHECGRAPLATTSVLHGSLGTARFVRVHGCWCTVQTSCACHGLNQEHAPESKTTHVLPHVVLYRCGVRKCSYIRRVQSPHVITISVSQSPRRAHACICLAIMPSCFHACFLSCRHAIPFRFRLVLMFICHHPQHSCLGKYFEIVLSIRTSLPILHVDTCSTLFCLLFRVQDSMLHSACAVWFLCLRSRCQESFSLSKRSVWPRCGTRMMTEAKWDMDRLETRAQYLARLRRTAMRLPTSFIKRSIGDLRRRCARLYDAR